MSSIVEHAPDEPRPPLSALPGTPGEQTTSRVWSLPNWKEWDWATIAPLLACIPLLAWLAWPLLRFWNYEFTKPETYYGHAPIIPFIVGLMFWYRREALAAVPKKPCLPALCVLIPALVLLVFSEGVHMEAMESTGFLVTIWSGLWLVLGTRFMRAAAFPLGFLLLMSPLPGPLLNDATLKIQMLCTHGAFRILHTLFGATLSGTIIYMDNFSLFVDVPCSGFKLLLSMLTFSAAFAYLIDGEPRKRLGLFLFSLPLSLVVNSVRIALIGVVGECISADAAHIFHDWSGLITLVLGFTALFTLAKVLGCRKFAGWPIF